MQRSLVVLLAVVLILAVTAGAGAAPRVSEVSLFKNGYGYFILTGELARGDGKLVIDEIPAAAHGTYWFDYNPRELNLHALTAGMADKVTVTERPRATLLELLEANVGREVDFYIGDQWQRGKIIALPKQNAQGQPQLVIIESEGKPSAIPVGAITRLRGGEFGGTVTETDTRTAPVLTLDYTASKLTDYQVSYLTPGITWAPAYRLDIADSPGRLVLQGVIINEATDLEKATINFISGFPNLMFANVISPLAMRGSLNDFINQLGGGDRYSGRRREMVMTQQVMFNAPAMSYGEERADYQAQGEGSTVEDLFFYTVRGITLKKNERGAYELLAGTLPYEHVYTWDIPAVDVNNSYSGRQQRESGQEQAGEVWHQLKVRNTFSQPLTTAPMMVVNGDRILGQDMLTYTSAGGTGRIKITRAVDVRAEEHEYEKARQPHVKQFYGDWYDLVTVEGTITIENFKRDPVRMEITRTVEGQLLESTLAVEAVKLATWLRRVNPQTKLTWEFTLPAGKKQEYRYTYQVYVR